jgi:hypothetical protein
MDAHLMKAMKNKHIPLASTVPVPGYHPRQASPAAAAGQPPNDTRDLSALQFRVKYARAPKTRSRGRVLSSASRILKSLNHAKFHKF